MKIEISNKIKIKSTGKDLNLSCDIISKIVFQADSINGNWIARLVLILLALLD